MNQLKITSNIIIKDQLMILMGLHEKNRHYTNINLIFLSICFCFSFNTVDSFQVAKSVKVVLRESKCQSKENCKCIIQQFTCDPNISFQKKEGRYSTSRSDADLGCFAVDLFMYKHKISLDSVYYASIKNKDLLYIGGFLEGTYSKRDNVVILKLTFLNSAINSSKSTDHTYLIRYNLNKNIVEQMKLKFE